MLRPAQLYEEELQTENMEAWYKPENIFWNGGPGDTTIRLPEDNYREHAFVSINEDEDILGYIAYYVDWEAMSADRFSIISYKKGSLMFAKDLYQVVDDLFEVYHLNRVSWCAYADNPAIRGYRNFIKKYGGRECGYHRQCVRLMDGILHDSVDFEIMASEYLANKYTVQSIRDIKAGSRKIRG